MPFYEYQCKNCGHALEAMQKISDSPLKKCPHCGKSQLVRLMSAPVFRLKGGGWYETDFKGDKDNQRNLADKPEADAPKEPDTKADKAKDDAKSTEAKATEAAPAKDSAATKDKPEKPAEKSPPPAAQKNVARKSAARGKRAAKKAASKVKRRR
jgi:putative FmdB family regulatory protein